MRHLSTNLDDAYLKFLERAPTEPSITSGMPWAELGGLLPAATPVIGALRTGSSRLRSYLKDATGFLEVSTSELGANSLKAIRHLALLAVAQHGNGECDLFARRWLQYVIGETSTSEAFFLQVRAPDDTTFFPKGSLRPKPRSDWEDSWSSAFPWLKNSACYLTLTELELALVLFKWDSDQPALAEWVHDCPHILWRVHRFLLKRYCLHLLGPFRRALCAHGSQGGWLRWARRRLGAWVGSGRLAGWKGESLHQPPFRAGELLWLQPRLFGMTLVGYLACLGLDALKLLFFAGPLWLAVGGLGVAFGALWVLYRIDIFKQNRGVLASARHGRPRVLGMVLRSLVVSALLSVAPMGYWAFVSPLRGVELDLVAPAGQPPLPGVVIPYLHATASWPPDWGLTARMTVGWLAMVATAAALGCMLQWFWEDTSTLEPV